MSVVVNPQVTQVPISLKAVLELAEIHRSWWLGRYPRLSSFRDDIFQESAAAAWSARTSFRPGLAAFATYVFNPMRRAVGRFFERQGVFRKGEWRWEIVGQRATVAALGASTSPATDRPTLLAEAADHLKSIVVQVGGRRAERDAEMVLCLVMGQEGADTARMFGVSRQRIHQIAGRWRSQFPLIEKPGA